MLFQFGPMAWLSRLAAEFPPWNIFTVGTELVPSFLASYNPFHIPFYLMFSGNSLEGKFYMQISWDSVYLTLSLCYHHCWLIIWLDVGLQLENYFAQNFESIAFMPVWLLLLYMVTSFYSRQVFRIFLYP